MIIHCFKCKKEFVPSEMNTKILGVYVEIKCPYCLDIYEGKLLGYVDHQIGIHRQQSPADGIKMIKLARFIELNSSEYYKTKGLRHGKKKVRNV